MGSVLVIGSGGREHALAWTLARSPQVTQVYVAPGNGGTFWEAAPGIAASQNLPFEVHDFPELIAFARQHQVTFTVVGPEYPLAEGVVDAFQAAGLAIFGPKQAAAQLEASKAFAKQFMQAEGIPTAAYGVFEDYAAAKAFLGEFSGGMVVKASGLAAGKGVLVCDTLQEGEAALQQIMLEKAFGEAGQQVVIEECLQGKEISVLAFSDGKTLALMPLARDHKRALDGDQGLNTGGMGAFAPVEDLLPAQLEEIKRTVLKPVLDGMAARGTPYVGVLYAGLMLTERGMYVLEFNCRFGDPETQVILPLLETDLLEVLQACVEGRLHEITLEWKNATCATVVLAAPGYPLSYPKGLPIQGLEAVQDDQVMVFHAGTRYQDDQVLTAGGRVLTVTGLDTHLSAAIKRVYQAISHIYFEGMHYRRDIGKVNAYQAAGVDIDAGQQAVEGIKAAVRATFTPAVLSDVGHFGGLFDATCLKEMAQPVLVASTDGVGTKTKVAAALGRWETIGQDLVNHCINDILVQGATPLFFMDYIASDKLKPEQIIKIVSGMAEACQAAGCALLGGETAEMPGVYVSGEVDVAGTIVGAVDRAAVLDGTLIQKGDVIIGLPSTGLHTNGFSLARKILKDLDWEVPHPDLGCSIGDALLAVHRSYLPHFQQLRGLPLHGMAHITGGGIVDNLPRIFPPGLGAVLQRGTWHMPPIFSLMQHLGGVDELEMYRVFNMGLGMLLVVPAEAAKDVQKALGEESYGVGYVVEGAGVRIQ